MKNKSILITGAGTGIGKDTAKSLLRRGHKVYAATHHENEVAGLRAELGEGAEVFKLDITLPEDRAKIADLPIEVLVNNAGIGECGTLADICIEKIKRVFEVNLFSSLALTQLAIRNMVQQGGGTIIFISSITGRVPAPFMMPYSMSKFAVSAAAAGLREEMQALDKGIHISVVEPGPFKTGFNQALVDSRDQSLLSGSLFTKGQFEKIKTEADKTLNLLEKKSTAPIVNKIISAAEAKRPRLRYVAPWHVAVLVRLLRILGV